MKKIGIVTFNDAYNFGAFLQEYALQTVLCDNGFDASVINYSNSYFRQQYLFSNNFFKKKGIKNKGKILFNILFRPKIYKERIERNKKFIQTIKSEIKLSLPLTYTSKTDINAAYDFFIAGSDQVWNVRVTNYNYFYFLDFVEDSSKKKSYAASFGRSFFDEDDLKKIKEHLKDFKGILVREESGKKLLEKMGFKAEVVLDPTLLLNREQWLLFAQKCKLSLPSKYIVVYIVAEQTYLLDVALKYAKENLCEIVFFSDKNRDIMYKGKRIKATVNIGPYDFIKYLAYADKVFSTSFHGMVLSINLNVDFYYELCKAKINNNARLESIANKLELTGRQIISDNLPAGEIDWERSNYLLDIERKKSQKLLIESLI